jgi:hypothetical protein
VSKRDKCEECAVCDASASGARGSAARGGAKVTAFKFK